jgi:hypothetical protein
MRLPLTLSVMAIAAVALVSAPGASAWRPAEGNYSDLATGTRPPTVGGTVEGRYIRLGIEIRRCGGLSANFLRQRRIRIERGNRFDITAPLPARVIRNGRRPNDRVRVIGRWTSPRTVVGRYRMWRTLVNRRTRRIRGCDTRWVRWRAAVLQPVDMTMAWPEQFAVPGPVTATFSVRNAGDFPSPDTLLLIEPSSQLGEPPYPPMQFATEQGSCRWPVDREEEGEVIECQLGTVAPRSTVTVTVTEMWDERFCDYTSSWAGKVGSPLNWFRVGDTVYGTEWMIADAPADGQPVCATRPEPPPEPELALGGGQRDGRLWACQLGPDCGSDDRSMTGSFAWPMS